jgi:hypothetical protein
MMLFDSLPKPCSIEIFFIRPSIISTTCAVSETVCDASCASTWQLDKIEERLCSFVVDGFLGITMQAEMVAGGDSSFCTLLGRSAVQKGSTTRD